MHAQIIYLGQTYFHQDYDLEAETPIGVLDAFLESETPESTWELRAEILSILVSGLSDDEIAEIWLEKSEACYDPRAEGISMRDWMHRMSEALAEES